MEEAQYDDYRLGDELRCYISANPVERLERAKIDSMYRRVSGHFGSASVDNGLNIGDMRCLERSSGKLAAHAEVLTGRGRTPSNPPACPCHATTRTSTSRSSSDTRRHWPSPGDSLRHVHAEALTHPVARTTDPAEAFSRGSRRRLRRRTAGYARRLRRPAGQPSTSGPGRPPSRLPGRPRSDDG